MTSSKKAGMYYFGINEKWVIEKFTPKEIARFLKEGKGLFSKLTQTKESKQYLVDHPQLAELINKW